MYTLRDAGSSVAQLPPRRHASTRSSTRAASRRGRRATTARLVADELVRLVRSSPRRQRSGVAEARRGRSSAQPSARADGRKEGSPNTPASFKIAHTSGAYGSDEAREGGGACARGRARRAARRTRMMAPPRSCTSSVRQTAPRSTAAGPALPRRRHGRSSAEGRRGRRLGRRRPGGRRASHMESTRTLRDPARGRARPASRSPVLVGDAFGESARWRRRALAAARRLVRAAGESRAASAELKRAFAPLVLRAPDGAKKPKKGVDVEAQRRDALGALLARDDLSELLPCRPRRSRPRRRARAGRAARAARRRRGEGAAAGRRLAGRRRGERALDQGRVEPRRADAGRAAAAR